MCIYSDVDFYYYSKFRQIHTHKKPAWLLQSFSGFPHRFTQCPPPHPTYNFSYMTPTYMSSVYCANTVQWIQSSFLPSGPQVCDRYNSDLSSKAGLIVIIFAVMPKPKLTRNNLLCLQTKRLSELHTILLALVIHSNVKDSNDLLPTIHVIISLYYQCNIFSSSK